MRIWRWRGDVVSRRSFGPLPPFFQLGGLLLFALALPLAAACPEALPVGTREIRVQGRLGRAWYPADGLEVTVPYPGRAGRLTRTSKAAPGAPLASCEKFPVILFSHGLGGSPTNSLPLVEELARRGYFVVALQHLDGEGRNRLRAPERWSEASFANRYSDIRNLLDALPNLRWANGRLDLARIGIVGHSLGGYTALGLAGGWGSWKDSRIRAAAVFSPFALPFQAKNTLGQINIPLLYQGGTLDLPLTPSLRAPDGIYALSRKPKYYLEWKNAGHLAWTNAECGLRTDISACATQQPLVRLQLATTVSFFDQYLRRRPGVYGPLANGQYGSNALVADWRQDP